MNLDAPGPYRSKAMQRTTNGKTWAEYKRLQRQRAQEKRQDQRELIDTPVTQRATEKKPWREYKRLQRQRDRERMKSQPDAFRELVKTPFCEFFDDWGGGSLEWCGDVLGEAWWDFSNDRGLQPLTDHALVEEDLSNASNSLGRAEVILSTLIDAAGQLSIAVNEYKRREITGRLKEIDEKDPINFGEVDRLKRMLYQLNRQVRWPFSQWKVTKD